MSIQTQITRITTEVATQAELIDDIEVALQGKMVPGEDITVEPITITTNGTTTAPSGKAYSPITTNVPASAVTSGTKQITSTASTDVTEYKNAQVSDANLISANIISGKSILGVNGSAVVPSGTLDITENGTKDVTNYANVNVNVASGGGKVIQYNPTITQVKNKTSYTTCNCSITVGETGTYKCSWVHWASLEQNTHATQLYRNSSAVGSAHTSPIYSNATGTNFVATETNVSLTAGQTIEVRARTRSGSNYYTTAGFLVIEKTN